MSGEVDEQAWEDEQRSHVFEYLAAQGVQHGPVGATATWSVSPYVSLWAVESLAYPGDVGWWVIAGDLPTDYLSSGSARTPRAALEGFGSRWMELAARMRSGHSSGEFSIGSRESWPELAPLLATRAELLLEWAADDSLWG